MGQGLLGTLTPFSLSLGMSMGDGMGPSSVTHPPAEAGPAPAHQAAMLGQPQHLSSSPCSSPPSRPAWARWGLSLPSCVGLASRAPLTGMADASEKRHGCRSAGKEVAAQGLLAAPLRPVLSCPVASSGHCGVAISLPTPISWRVTKDMSFLGH